MAHIPHFEVAPWMRDEMLRRKDLVRRLWAGQPVERIPLDVRVPAPPAHTTRAQFRDREAQLADALASVIATWVHAPSSDAIPAMRPDVGCSCLASAFGAETYWGESEDQTPGIRTPPIADLEREVDGLPAPDPHWHGLLPEGLRRIRLFVEATDGFVPVSLLDAAGGMNVAADLLGVEGALLATRTAPDALHRLLERIQDLFAATIRAGIEAAGGEDYITTTDYPDTWFPEGWKGHASDDICAMFGPDVYAEFSAPYHARIFREFGAGGLHNCGPNPCAFAYMAGDPSPRSLDLADTYSHRDLPVLRSALRGRALIYLGFCGGEDPVEWYRGVMDALAPHVIAIPMISVRVEDDPEHVIARLRIVAAEYARRMDWGWR